MATCAPHADAFEVLLHGSPDAVPRLRQAFEQWLHDTGIDAQTADELNVVFSELVTNAVQASQGADQEVEVAAWTEDDRMVLRVANPVTPSSAPVTAHDLDDPMRAGGRGLLIVRAFTDAMSIDSDGDCIVVRCERSFRS